MSGSDACQGLEQRLDQGFTQDLERGLPAGLARAGVSAGVSSAVPGVLELLDQVVESAVVVRPVWGADGAVADFTIEHLSPGTWTRRAGPRRTWRGRRC